MGQVHKTISITPEQDQFIEEKNLNVSHIVQNHIETLRNGDLNPQFFQNKIKALESQVEHWKELFDESMDYIKKIGVFEDFCKSKGY